MKYRRDIDGLRAIAVVSVILFHAGFQIFKGGFIGVDIFFVISGYLITTIIISELNAGHFSIVKFYERRARRILPALFLVIFICIPFAWLWLFPPEMKSFSQSLVAVSTFSSNFFFWRTNGYFNPDAELNPMLHTWSLAVEEQFYVFFPVLLMLTWKSGKRTTLAILSFIFVTSLILTQIAVFVKPVATFYLLPTRGWELLIGSFVAFYLANTEIKTDKPNTAQLGSLAGLALILFSIFFFDKHTPFPSVYALIPTIGAALIILYSSPGTLAGRILGSPPLVGIGLISYSAYLWHQPIFASARHIYLDSPSPALMLCLTLSSFALAFLGWKFVETPFRDKKKFERKTIFTYGVAFSFLIIAFGLFGSFSNGFESRLPSDSRDIAIYGKPDSFSGSRVSDGSCRDLLGLPILSEEVCLANSRKPKVMFVGDSHAMALYSSIHDKLFELDSVLISGHACPLYPNINYTPFFKDSFGNNCPSIANEVLDAARKIDSIETVVLVNDRTYMKKAGYNFSVDGKHLTSQEAFFSGNDFLVSTLIGLGKKVIYFIDVPHLNIDPRFCLQKLPYAVRLTANPGFSKECSIKTKDNAEDRQDYLNEVFKLKSIHPKMMIFDSASYFCTGDSCNFRDGNKSLYNDTHHVSAFGSFGLLNTMKSEGLIDHGGGSIQ